MKPDNSLVPVNLRLICKAISGLRPNTPLELTPQRVEQDWADFESWCQLASFPDLYSTAQLSGRPLGGIRTAVQRGVLMRLLHRTTEDDMIAIFLKAEILSERFGQEILMQLKRGNRERSVVDAPDISSERDNSYRRQLLASYRAYVFEELPAHTAWYRAVLSRDEVTKIRYIDYSYWNEISDNTRRPIVAAEAIRAGREIYGENTQNFLRVAQALRTGAQFPELIVVGASPEAALTVFEGHVRLTAYLLAPECIPTELEVIAGFAPECATL